MRKISRKPECVNRLEGSRKALCLNPSHPQFKRQVSRATCRKCAASVREVKVEPTRNLSPEAPSERLQEAHTPPLTITPQGQLIYTLNGWEPPPVPPGYYMLDSKETDGKTCVLEPIDAVCKHLELQPAESGRCGYPRVSRRCQLIDSFVGPRTCLTCKWKETDAR